MQSATTRCAHCDTPIVDPTTQVVHGDKTYCCPNCSAAMEQGGQGSDPHALEQAGDLRCAHCRAVIVDEATMVTRGDEAYCCSNCAAAMGTHSPTR
jgi:hypothetical protein